MYVCMYCTQSRKEGVSLDKQISPQAKPALGLEKMAKRKISRNQKEKGKKKDSEKEGIRTPADKVHENAELIFGNQQVTNVFVT